MKLVNFASLDPNHQQRNVSGLRNASQQDRAIVEEFSANWEQLAFESEAARQRLVSADIHPDETTVEIPDRETEREQLVRVRTVQSFFRNSVLASYEFHCAMCGIGVIELLTASHIIPWKLNVPRRADPTNGLSLCTLHDRAFDRGYLAIDKKGCILVADSLKINNPPSVHRVALLAIEGQPLMMPRRFLPDDTALTYHRENIFQVAQVL